MPSEARDLPSESQTPPEADVARLTPRPREDVPEVEADLRALEDRMGFLPNSMLVMAHKPGLVHALTNLARQVYDPDGKTPLPLRHMVGHMASRSAGCMYCAAHTANNAVRSDLPPEKLEAVWEFETSPLFDPAERAALRLANRAALQPNAVTNDDIAEMKQHFDEQEIVELMAVICWFGFLNRWNDTLATQLEDLPLSVASGTVASSGWTPGKHSRDG